MATEENFL